MAEAGNGKSAGEIEISFTIRRIADDEPLRGLPKHRKVVRQKSDVAAFDSAQPVFQFFIRDTHGADGCATDDAVSGWLWLRFDGRVRASR